MLVIRRTVVAVLELVLAAAVPGIQAATASSATDQYGTLSATDQTVSGKTCANVVIRFAPANTIQDWQVEFTVDPPNGNWLPVVTLTAAAPTHTLTLCPGRDDAGFYRLSGTMHANSTAVPPGSACCSISAGYGTGFTFRVINRIPTALTVTVVRSHRCPLGMTRHCSLVTNRLTRGGHPWGDWVMLQEVVRGRWTRVSWCHGDTLGRCGWYVVIGKSEIRARFRVYFPIHDYAMSSSSRVFHLFY